MRPIPAALLAMTFSSLVCAVVAFGSSALRAEEPAKPQPHADDLVKDATARFEKEFSAGELDAKVRILKWYGMHQHKTVLKKLTRILEREPELELKQLAALGIGNQASEAKEARSVLEKALETFRRYGSREDPEDEETERVNEFEARVLVACIDGLRVLHPHAPRRHKNDNWDEIKVMIDHMHDDVAIAMFKYCGETKEWRALPQIMEWFNFYPDGVSWAGASATVDTGAAGTKDANAARSKVKSMMAGRRKKARPNAWLAMAGAVKAMTGEEMAKPADLKAWMEEKEDFLAKQGV